VADITYTSDSYDLSIVEPACSELFTFWVGVCSCVGASVLSDLNCLDHNSKWVCRFYNYLTHMFILIREMFRLKTILIVYSCGKTLRLNVKFGQNNVCLYY